MATRVLVVDDSVISLKLTCDTLTQAGYEVLAAKNGMEALMQVDRIQPGLIILDVMMPEMDGYEVCRRLRRKPNTAYLPIMMLTAQDTLEEKIKGFEAGADDYMTKPFQPVELLAHAKVLLRRAKPVLAEGKAEEKAAEKPALRGKIIAIFSLRGGVGVSTLAANLSTGLAQLWDQPAILVDLSLMAGQSALMLNLTPRTTWADLAQVPLGEIDGELVESTLLSHASGAYVLAAPRRPEQSELLTAEKVSHVLSLLRERFHYLVLDLPHNFHEITLTGLDAADEILTVMAPELASVLAMSSTLEVFENLNYARENIRLALNQTFERNGLARKVIEDALRHPADMVIPFASETFVQAINLGTPPILSAPNTPIAALLEDCAFRISKEEHRRQRPANPTKTWQRVAYRLQQRQRKK